MKPAHNPANLSACAPKCHKCPALFKGVCSDDGVEILHHANAGYCPRQSFPIDNPQPQDWSDLRSDTAAMPFGRRSTVAEILPHLSGPVIKGPPEWLAWPNVQEAYRQALRAAADAIPPFDAAEHQGDGILIPGGGKYYATAYASIRVIRETGCKLPIELWLLPDERLQHWQRLALEPYNVIIRQPKIGEMRQPWGWELKVWAMAHTRFARFIFLDADCYPVTNPERFLEWPEYAQTGLVMWPDRNKFDDSDSSPGARLPKSIFDRFGIPYRDEWSIEAGQMLVDLERAWPAVWLANWMCQRSEYYFRGLPPAKGEITSPYGDKDFTRLASIYLNKPYAVIPQRWTGASPAILSHDFHGGIAFVHRVNGKLAMDHTDWPLTEQHKLVRNDDLPHEALVHRAIDDLRAFRDQHRPKFHGVVVSIQHDDFLRATIAANIKQLDSLMVVTEPGDPAIAIAKEHGARVLLSERKHSNGSRFNLGALRNDAFRKLYSELGENDWILSHDGDCILPDNLRDRLWHEPLDPDSIYGITRKGDGSEEGDNKVSGFFQLFHSSQRGRFYRDDHEDAGMTDMWFRNQWPKRLWVVLEGLTAQHLGVTGLDWSGRLQPAYEPPKAKGCCGAVATVARGAVGIAKAVTGVDPATPAQVSHRLQVCEMCDQRKRTLGVDRCVRCDCIIRLKVRVASESCPLNKWQR